MSRSLRGVALSVSLSPECSPAPSAGVGALLFPLPFPSLLGFDQHPEDEYVRYCPLPHTHTHTHTHTHKSFGSAGERENRVSVDVPVSLNLSLSSAVWRRFSLGSLSLSCEYPVGFVVKQSSRENWCQASLEFHWLRICLPMLDIPVWSLVQEDPTCHGSSKPMHDDYMHDDYHSPFILEPVLPREATTMRMHCN